MPEQNCLDIADDILVFIFVNKNVWISIKITLIFAPECPAVSKSA